MVPKAVITPCENPLVPADVPPPTGPAAPPLPPHPPRSSPRERPRPASESRTFIESVRGVRMSKLLRWVNGWIKLVGESQQRARCSGAALPRGVASCGDNPALACVGRGPGCLDRSEEKTPELHSQ